MRKSIIVILVIFLTVSTRADLRVRPTATSPVRSHALPDALVLTRAHATSSRALAGTLTLPRAMIGAMTSAAGGAVIVAGGTYMVPTTAVAAQIPAYPAGSEWALSRDGGRTWATHISTDDPYKGGSLTSIPWAEGSATWPVQFRANGLAINPRQTSEMWATGCMSPEQLCQQARGGHMVLHTVDGGQSWRDALIYAAPMVGQATRFNIHTNIVLNAAFINALRYGGATPTEAFSLLIDPSNSNKILVSLSGFGLLQSVNDGRTWTFVPSPALADLPTFTELVRDPQHPSTIYDMNRGGQLLRSLDNGLHWQTRSDLPRQLHSGMFSLTIINTVLYVTVPRAILASHDGGATWAAAFVSPPVAGGLLSSLRVHGQWVSAFVSQSPFSFPDGLYSPTSRSTWRLLGATDSPSQMVQGHLDLASEESAFDTRLWAIGSTLFLSAQLGGLYRIG